MNKLTKFLFSLVIVLCLSGCGKNADTPATDNQLPDSANCMPVLSITTVSQDENVMDFVTKPVSEHVSEQIASWTEGYEMPPAPYYEECTITLTEADGSTLLLDASAQVKVRGNWTTEYAKKPLRIKFDEKQNLLGLNDGAEMKNWVLTAEYKDGSMLRNKTAYTIANEILGEDNLYVTDAAFVEVEINGEYWGVYLLAEQQEIKSNRIDITEAEDDYTGTDIGYFLEFDGYWYTEDELQRFYVDYTTDMPLTPFNGNYTGEQTGADDCLINPDVGMTIKSDVYSTEQRDFIASYVNNVYKIMYAAAYEDKAYVFNDSYTKITESDTLSPQEAVEKVVNVDSLADTYIINELFCDPDLGWSSFCMDVDFGAESDKKLTFEAPWDFDSAMGNRNCIADSTGFYAAGVAPDEMDDFMEVNPWIVVLMHEEWFQDIIREKWNAAYDDGVFDRAYEAIGNDATLYSASFVRNYEKWDNLENNQAFVHELSEGAAGCTTHAEAAAYLSEWLKKRVEFLNGYWHE